MCNVNFHQYGYYQHRKAKPRVGSGSRVNHWKSSHVLAGQYLLFTAASSLAAYGTSS